MRSLQDWLRYVEEQSELAQKKKEKPSALSDRESEGEKKQALSEKLSIPSFRTSHPSAKVEAPISWRLTAPITKEEAQVLQEVKSEDLSPPLGGRASSLQQTPAPRQEPPIKETTAPPSPPEGEPSAQEILDRLPRHLHILARTFLQEEKAQKYYKRPFRESREDLIRRLLDPELTLEETARILGVCPTTVRRYTNRGWLKHHRTVGNQRRFRLSDVLEFLEKQGKLE